MKSEEGGEGAMVEIDVGLGHKKIPGGRGWFLNRIFECVFQVDPAVDVQNNGLMFIITTAYPSVFSH